MFYLRREREERESGRSEAASLAAAAATSGRAVMVSGFTVMIAMAGMYLAGAPTFRRSPPARSSSSRGRRRVAHRPSSRPCLAWRPCGEGAHPLPLQEKEVERRREWGVVANPEPGPSPSGRRRRGRRRVARVLGDPSVQPPHGDAGRRDASAGPRGDQDVQPHPGGLPGRADSGPGRRACRRREVAAGDRCDQRPQRSGRRQPGLQAADHDHREPRSHGRAGRHPGCRRRHRLPIDGGPGAATRQADPGHHRTGPGRDGRRHRLYRQLDGLQRHDEVARPGGLRLRPLRGLHPAVVHVPLRS